MPDPAQGYILNFTPTGMIPNKALTPHVPITPAEIIDEVLEAVSLGVNMVHLHARDPVTGAPLWQREAYAALIEPLRRSAPDLIIVASTSGRIHHRLEERADVLKLSGSAKPDMASLTLGSINFMNEASVNPPDMIKALAEIMHANGIRPELEVFDLGMINYANHLIQKGLLQTPAYFNLILGNIAGAQASPEVLDLLLNHLPEQAIWSLGGLGRFQQTAHGLAHAAGGGLRVGLEDNLFLDAQRTILASNRQLLERALQQGEACGRKPFSCAEARTLLALPPSA